MSYETVKGAYALLTERLSQLAGEEIGPSGKSWQELAVEAELAASEIAAGIADIRLGPFPVFPSPWED